MELGWKPFLLGILPEAHLPMPGVNVGSAELVCLHHEAMPLSVRLAVKRLRHGPPVWPGPLSQPPFAVPVAGELLTDQTALSVFDPGRPLIFDPAHLILASQPIRP